MGAVQRRARQREEVRSQIVEAARRIVIDEGYHALTMRRIAEAIEYSPAAIYQYFENRDAIAVAVSSEGFAQLLASFEPARAIGDPLKRLEKIGRAYVAFGLAHPQAYRLMFMEDPEITNAVLENAQPDDPGAQAYAALIEPVAQLSQAGRLRSDDPADVQRIADTLWVALHGIVSLKLTCPAFPQTPVEPLVDTTIATFLSGALKK